MSGSTWTVDGGRWTVQGAGADIWGTTDAFEFAEQPLVGDGEVVARVTGMTNTNPWAKAGVMIRDSFNANARYAMCVLTPSRGIAFQRRLATGGRSSHTAGALVHAPYWVKLTRVGSLITASQSPDGTTWKRVGSQSIAMGSSVFIDLMVTSHADGTLCTATFDHVGISAVVHNG